MNEKENTHGEKENTLSTRNPQNTRNPRNRQNVRKPQHAQTRQDLQKGRHAGKICGECGHRNPFGRTTCQKCGIPFSNAQPERKAKVISVLSIVAGIVAICIVLGVQNTADQPIRHSYTLSSYSAPKGGTATETPSTVAAFKKAYNAATLGKKLGNPTKEEASDSQDEEDDFSVTWTFSFGKGIAIALYSDDDEGSFDRTSLYADTDKNGKVDPEFYKAAQAMVHVFTPNAKVENTLEKLGVRTTVDPKKKISNDMNGDVISYWFGVTPLSSGGAFVDLYTEIDASDTDTDE